MRCRIAHQRLIALAAAIVGACSTPDHSNVLIFATNTKVALDVSVSPTSSAPEITLGYKRQEGVWMPLVPNIGKNDPRTAKDCLNEIEKCGFVGTQTGTSDGNKKDAYSVLASFGANFSAGAQGATTQGPQTSATASGGLAQFFATGIAAQKLADAGGARLVSISSNDKIEQKITQNLSSIPEFTVDVLQLRGGMITKFQAHRRAGTDASKTALQKYERAAGANGYPRPGRGSIDAEFPAFVDFISDTSSQAPVVTAIKASLENQGETFQ